VVTVEGECRSARLVSQVKIASNWGDREGVKAPPQSYMVGMSNTVVRIFKHEESFEVSSLDVLLFRRQPRPAGYQQAHEVRSGRVSREGLREGPARR